ncbi:RNA polymerase sigma factor [Simiduia curdlanivorans]|uniref:RNA polymerase sigma factor n=1 Tax=Simiduia curdlanivorans TaxID=1492769 RepID=A0ABV8V1Y2_9GAMM|nr:RNA polymerase sigma factor [Simiduia curdlanivorans]MDN3640131.1 RNA polymerase sigma factor [Simiduia curdlanivorans]
MVEPQNLDSFLASVERRAFRMALFATKQESDALDIVQDSMLKLVQYYRGKPSGEWGPLFHRILQHKIAQWHRDQSKQRRWFWQPTALDEEDISLTLAAPSIEEPEDSWVLAMNMEKVMAAIESLPLRQQQTFLLRAWEGYDVASTADIMGCSEGSIKTHYFRALQTLRSNLQELG